MYLYLLHRNIEITYLRYNDEISDNLTNVIKEKQVVVKLYCRSSNPINFCVPSAAKDNLPVVNYHSVISFGIILLVVDSINIDIWNTLTRVIHLATTML